VVEKTEVLYGHENILRFMLPRYPSVKENIDACYDYSGPPDVVKVEPVWRELLKLGERGIKIRFLTDIRKENIEACKKFLSLETLEMRHLDGIKGNFGIADRREFLEHIINREEEPLTHAIFSTAKVMVDARQYVFDNLWRKAIPAEDRIKEIEEGVEREFIQTIRDPNEIQKLGFDLVKSSTNEILIVFSTANAFLRQIERAKGNELLKEAAQDREVKIRILTPMDTLVEQSAQKLLEGLQRKQDIEIRYIEPHLQTKVTILLTDRKYSLTVELKDDTKETSYDAIGLATYSNSKSTVLSYASIFESLWKQTEMYEQLKIHDKMQKEFINIAAHELRTPIQPILGLADIVGFKFKEDKQLSQLLDVIIRNAKRLQRLTEDILDVTKIESNRLELHRTIFDLNDILVSLIADYKREEQRTKGHRKIRLSFSDNMDKNVVVEGDKERITQVVSNLLSNAIKFTDKGGEISLSIKRDTHQVIVSVKDNGQGINPEIYARLFTKFATNSSMGTGLGLYISKSIVEAHGGKMWAENNSDGKGATFTFSLPIY
jgi:two-component system sensor histidine kinase VicK